MKIRKEITLCSGHVQQFEAAKARLDTSKFSGTCLYYYEANTVSWTSPGSTSALRRSGTSTSDATLSIGAAGLYRSTAFSPVTNGQDYYPYVGNSVNLMQTPARIIVLQDTGSDPLTATESQFEIGSQVTAFTTTTPFTFRSKYFKYVAADWDGTLTCYFEAVALSNNSMYDVSVTLQVADGTGDGFVGWSTVATLSTPNTTATRMRSTAFTPIDGRNYRIVMSAGNSMGSCDVYNAKIIIEQTGSDITKTCGEYLMSAQALAGTSNQLALTKHDLSEWDGVTNEYFHVIDATDNNTSVVDLRDENSNQLSGSVVTSPDNQKFSSAVSMERQQEYYEHNSGSLPTIYGGTTQGAKNGTTFTPLTNFNLSKVQINLRKQGSPTDNVICKLRLGIDGTVIDSASIAASTLLVTGTLASFEFSTKPLLSTGTTYFFELSRSGSRDTVNYAIVFVYTIDKYTGNAYYIDDTNSWVEGLWLGSTVADYEIKLFSTNSMVLDVRATTNVSTLHASRIFVKSIKQVVTSRRAITRARFIY